MFIITKEAFVWSAPKLKLHSLLLTRVLQWFKEKEGGQVQPKAWAFTRLHFLCAYIIKNYIAVKCISLPSAKTSYKSRLFRFVKQIKQCNFYVSHQRNSYTISSDMV